MNDVQPFQLLVEMNVEVQRTSLLMELGRGRASAGF